MEKFKLTKLQALGLFVLLTLIATFAVVNFLRGEDLFNKSTTYYANFETVDGLTVTGPVFIKGLKVGMVEEIEYDMENDYFEVEFKIKSKFQIPDNSVAEIYSSDIMGSRALRITMGNSKVYAEGEDTLASAIVPDMVTALTSEIMPLKDQAVKLMAEMETTLDNVNMLLDSGARKDIQSSFANLNRTLANAVSLSAAINEVSPELKDMVRNLQTLSEGLEKSSGSIQGSLANVNEITSQLSQAELGKTVESLRNLLEKMQDPDGSVGKLLATDSLHNAVTTLLNDVDALVKGISEDPKKYIKVSVF